MLSAYGKAMLADLRRASTNGLVLVAGAGINGRAAPKWNEIVRSLTKRSLAAASIEEPSMDGSLRSDLTEWCQRTFDPVALATLAKHLLGNRGYQAELQDIVYGSTDESEVEGIRQGSVPPPKLAYLQAVAELASEPTVRAVATFNFDTYLEKAVNALGERSAVAHFGPTRFAPDRPCATDPQPASRKTVLPVYHVHGLLSSPTSVHQSTHEAVVLAYDEYFGTNADPLAWETSTVVHLLRNYCTLWLGTSMRDWNMLRLLDAARKPARTDLQAYCLQCLDEVKASTKPKMKSPRRSFVQAAMRLQATLMAAVGARLIVGGRKFSDLPNFLTNEITKRLT